MQVAARHCQADICALLIREGADCNARDFEEYRHKYDPTSYICWLYSN